MSYGKDERDIDKHIWRLPIPQFDPADNLHSELSRLGGAVEAQVQQLELSYTRNFVSLRRQVRSFLSENRKAQEIEQLVRELLT